MSMLKIVVLSVVAFIIQQFILAFTQRKRQQEAAELEADLDSLIADSATTDLDLDLWESRHFSQIESLQNRGLGHELLYKLRHFQVA